MRPAQGSPHRPSRRLPAQLHRAGTSEGGRSLAPGWPEPGTACATALLGRGAPEPLAGRGFREEAERRRGKPQTPPGIPAVAAAPRFLPGRSAAVAAGRGPGGGQEGSCSREKITTII